MTGEIIENQRRLLEDNISKRLKSLSFSDAGLCSGSFFLLGKDLAEWQNPPIDLSYITDTQTDGNSLSSELLSVSLQEAEQRKDRPAWKGIMIRLLPPTEYPEYFPHITAVLVSGEAPNLLYMPGKPLDVRKITEPRIKIGRFSLLKKSRFICENLFESVRSFEDSDYLSLNRLVSKLRGPIPK